MQMVRALLCSAALCTGWAAQAPRSLRAPKATGVVASKSVTAPAQGIAVSGEVAPGHLDSAPVLEEVDVPVVIVVDSGVDDMSERPFQLSEACRKEVASSRPETESALTAAKACEQKGGYTEKVLAALKEANNTQARAYAAGTFSDCLHLSRACAKEMAPDVVMAARFSGMAITEACRKRAQQLGVDATSKTDIACKSNASKAIAVQLQRFDMEGATEAAQHGLEGCSRIKSPCDFQLAPMLVHRLVQFAEQQQMQEVLMAGLRQAEELQAKLVSSGSQETHVAELSSTAPRTAKAQNASEPPSKLASKKVPKALSLLNIAERIRITSAPRLAHF